VKKIDKIDVVIPVYRSTNSVAELVERLELWVASNKLEVHVYFVDDRGEDGTVETLTEALKKSSFSYTVLQMTKNVGQYTATAAGFYFTTADWVATIDDDLQHDPFELDKLIAYAEEHADDLIYGYYDEKKHSTIRNFGSRILKYLFKKEGVNFDHVTSFRLMRNHVIEPFKQRTSQVLFLDERLYHFSHQVGSLIVKHHERKDGKSSHTTWKLIQLTFTIVLFHSSLPLKWITRFGLFMALIFMGFGLYFIYNKLVNNAPLGFTSLIVAIFFSTGIILLSLGVIGEYIRKIWVHQQRMTDVTVIKKD